MDDMTEKDNPMENIDSSGSASGRKQLLRRAGLLTAGAMMLASASVVATSTSGQGAASPTWFTEEQAARGERTFLTSCAACHGADWAASRLLAFSSADAFFAFVSASMPYDGDLLPVEQYVDIIAFLMSNLGLPAGETELPYNRNVLAGMVPREALVQIAQAETGPGEVGAWYTAAQAEAGLRAFGTGCAGCHGAPDMIDLFATYTTAWDYYAFISASMPADNPGGLAPNDYLTITAYLMSENGFPAGEEALTNERSLLEAIVPAAPGAAAIVPGTDTETPAAEGAAPAAETENAVDGGPGLFTAAQAEAGATAFGTGCAGCHGAPDMLDLFVGYTTAWSFFAYISESMPADNPGGLAPSNYVSITAYLMREAGFPAGDFELTNDRTLLGEVIPAEAPAN